MDPLYIFFDTETTGLPVDWKAPVTTIDNWPRIIQLAWALYDETGTEIGSKCDLIKPDGWKIPNQKFWIDNGYSTEKNEAEGIPIRTAIDTFISAVNVSKGLVAHNMSYDYNVIGAEMIRAGLDHNLSISRYCTKELGTEYCKLPGNYGKYKWPTLTEFHTKLFGTGFEGAHDALFDVRACAKCFFRLKELGIIKS